MPQVATRHLVVSFPPSIVSALARGQLSARETQRVFEQVLFEALDQQARARLGLSRRAKLGFGAASIVHPFTNDLRFGPHLHALVVDGAFVREDEELRFEPSPPGEGAPQLGAMAAELAARLHRAVRPEQTSSPRLVELRRAARAAPAGAAQRPQPRTPEPASAVTRSRGVRIHVSEQIAASDHRGRRRVLEYLGRSPLDPSRIELRSDGRVLLELPRPRRDGAEAIELSAAELARRVAALGSLTEPGAIRQHGLLARRTARRWGIEAEQLSLPALNRDGGKVRKAGQERREAPASDSSCRHCGGRLVAAAVELA